jgi:hypothetical protein
MTQSQHHHEVMQELEEIETRIAGLTSANTEKELKMNQQTDLNSLSFAQLVPTNSNYLKKDDVGEDGVILTIRGFKQETLKTDTGDETKVVMYFMEEGYKPMVLNTTNATILGKITGCQTAGEARGKQVVVYDDPTVSFGGKNTGGLRLKKVQGAPAAPKQAAKTADPFDQDVPFN